jgi:hypothetical protein
MRYDAMRHDEPRLVWTRLTTTHVLSIPKGLPVN